MTKREMFEMVIAMANGTGFTDEEMVMLAEMAEKEITTLDKRKAKDAEKRAEKRNDGLLEAVFEALTDEFLTADEILERVDGVEDATIGKVRNRLTALVNEGKAEKADIKVDKRRVKGYKVV